MLGDSIFFVCCFILVYIFFGKDQPQHKFQLRQLALTIKTYAHTITIVFKILNILKFYHHCFWYLYSLTHSHIQLFTSYGQIVVPHHCTNMYIRTKLTWLFRFILYSGWIFTVMRNIQSGFIQCYLALWWWERSTVYSLNYLDSQQLFFLIIIQHLRIIREAINKNLQSQN